MPKRIQLRRTKGWRKPEGAVVVARPSKWGNPFHVADAIEHGSAEDDAEARSLVVDAFREWLVGDTWAAPYRNDERLQMLANLREIAGRDLACWCPTNQPCHADVLLKIANGDAS